MRRIKVILAVVASVITVMMVMAAPVMAQGFGQEFRERRITSGAANPTTRISNTGDNVNLCTPVQQVSNTGNIANEQGVVEGDNGFFPTDNRFGFFPNDNRFPVDNRFGFFPNDNFGSGFGNGELDFTGSEINIEPTATAECVQTLDQAAAAGG
jgi:hypothetical protein